MSLSGSLVGTVTVGGTQFSTTQTRSDSGRIEQEVACLTGVAGTLGTRTNDTEGVITLTAEHGLSTGTFDVYFTGGERHQISATIDGNAATISSGSGDNLPIEDSAVVFSPRTEVDSDLDGDLVQFLAAGCTTRAGVEFTESDDGNLLNVALPAGEAYVWAADTSITNPLDSAAVGKIYCSSGTAATCTVKIGIVYDSEV